MSEEKKYTPLEAALMIRETLVKMVKSANSSHEIDPGEEISSESAQPQEESAPSTDGEGFSGEESSESEEDKKKKKKEEGSEEETEESYESEESEESEEKYDFNKGESGMHSIVYQTLKKKEDTPSVSNPSFKNTKPGEKKYTNTQTEMVNATRPGKRKASQSDQNKFEAEAKIRRAKIKEENLGKEEVKATGGMDKLDKPHTSDMAKEKFKRPLQKCDDVKGCDCNCKDPADSGKLKDFISKKKTKSDK